MADGRFSAACWRTACLPEQIAAAQLDELLDKEKLSGYISL
jgi:hypothetical protein